MLTERERFSLSSIDGEREREEEIVRLWTKKESIFKTFNSDKYIPAEIETSDYDVYTESFDTDGVLYHLSVSGSDIPKIRIFKDIIL